MITIHKASSVSELPQRRPRKQQQYHSEDVDVPVDIAKQAVLYVHANFASELSQHR